MARYAFIQDHVTGSLDDIDMAESAVNILFNEYSMINSSAGVFNRPGGHVVAESTLRSWGIVLKSLEVADETGTLGDCNVVTHSHMGVTGCTLYDLPPPELLHVGFVIEEDSVSVGYLSFKESGGMTFLLKTG
jgi:hypothetical protein